jgi:hypothetical protein
MSNSQRGFTHLLAILVVAVGLFSIVSSFVPINRKYNDGKSDVAGVYTTSSASAKAKMEKPEVKVASEGGQTAFVEKGVGALSTFPISINPKTNELTVTTPSGTKVVTVLPQKAVDNMLASKVMTDVVSEKADGNLGSIPSLVQLELKNGVLGYKIMGTKTHKLLGIIPIKTEVLAFVSAENGQVVDTTESFLGRLLNKIAP